MSISERPWFIFLLLPLLLILSLSDISAATPDLSPLPAESMVINRPVAFYEQYKYLTLAVSWVFAFLLLAVGILAVTIVRQLRAERKLRDSEGRHRNLVETSFDWIWEVDAQVRFTYASPRVLDFLGYTPEEMLGRTPFDFMPEAEAGRVGEIFGAIAAARRPFTALENVNLHRDGRLVVLETSGAPIFGPEGEFKGYRGSDRDITTRQAAEQALRESEERLRLANEAANIGTLDVDLETGQVRFSPELCAILGVPPGREWNGHEAMKIVHPEDRDLVMAAHRRSQDPAGEGRIYSEHRIIRPDGEVRWLVWSGRTIFRDTAAGRVPCRGIAVAFDVTERKRAEKALRESEERYRLLVSQIPAMVFQGYGDWSIDPFDEKVEVLTGYSKEDFESRRLKWCDLIPAEDLDYATRVFIEALKTDKSYVREHRLRRKDGEIRWVQCRGQIFCNDQGKVDYISGVSFDVTERRRAQEALKERERFLADIFDSIQDGICILETDFNILRVNQAMELLFPHALPLVGKKCYEAYRRRSAPCEVCLSRETLETGKAGRAVMTKIGPDGEADGWLEVYTFPMLEISSGKVRGIIQDLRDITKRKQAEEALELSEEKYRLLVKQIPAVAFKGYADWSVDFFDNKIEALTGYSKEVFDSRQIKWCNLILPEDLEQAKGRFINGIKTGGAYGREYRIRKKDGEIAWIQAMGQIFYDAEGKLDYISGVFFDITLRKQTQEKLKESERNLRYLAAQLLTAQERERQRISRDLHDDLGQSLIALKLHLEVIEGEEPANLTVLRQKLATQIAFIDDIVNNVRRLCMDLHPTTLDVLGLIVALKRLFKEFSALYGIKFSLDLDNVRNLLTPQAQIVIYRIFQESLTNIAKYAQATRATVTIKRKNDTVFFSVQDNGKGFDLEQVRTRSVGERGLGLTAMEERVRMLGGTLEMQSQKGVGTRISFKIPVSLLRHSKVGN